jgi:hypothetical protein
MSFFGLWLVFLALKILSLLFFFFFFSHFLRHPYADAYAPIAFGGGCMYALLRSLAPGAHAARIAATVGSVALARQQATADGWRLPWWNAHSVVTYGNADPRVATSADSPTARKIPYQPQQTHRQSQGEL